MSDQDERDNPAATPAVAEGSGADANGTDSASGSPEERMDLPKWNRARVKRKQPKGEEQDGFQAGVRKAGKAALTQAPVVIGLIVLLAGVIAGVVWYRGELAEDRAAATRVLSEVAAIRVRGEIEEADVPEGRLLPPAPRFADEASRSQRVDEVLGQLQSDMDASDANTLAGLLRAGRMMQSGQFSEAQASYTSFIEQHPKHALTPLAHEGLALALEATGDVDAALAELDNFATEAGTFYRDQALYHKARMLEGQGKSDEALAAYKLYAEEYPLAEESLAKAAVIKRLKELAPELVPEDANKAGFPGGLAFPPGQGG